MTTRPDDVVVEFLYLDRGTCERCRMTEAAVEAALAAVRPVLAVVGVGVILDRVHVDSAATAERVALEVSPTVRVDGRDVQPEFETTGCDCGGTETVPCRAWRHGDRVRERPPVSLITDAVLRAAYGIDWVDDERDGTDDHTDVGLPVTSYFDEGTGEGCC